MRKLMVGLLCFSFMLMGIYTEKINVSASISAHKQFGDIYLYV